MIFPFFVLSIGAVVIIFITLLLALKWKILAKMGMRNAIRRKVTMMLIIAGSLTGTAFIVGSFVINDSFQYFMYSGIRRNLGTIDEVLVPNKATYFSDAEVSKIIEALSNSEYVESVLPIMTKSTVAAPIGQIRSLNPSKIAQVNFIGVNLDQLRKFDTGKLFPDLSLSGNSVVVSEKFANALNLKVGDSFEAIINPFQIILGSPQKFKIAGIVPQEGVLGYQDIQGITSPIFMTIEQMKEIFSIDNYNEILIANKGNYISGAKYTQNVDSLIKALDVPVRIYNVKEEQIKNLNQGQIGWLFLILSGFSIAAGVLLLINVYTMLSDERKSDLGTLRAIGFSRFKVGFILYFEGFVYSLISSFLGIFVGLGIAWFMINEFSNLATNVSHEFTPLINTGTFNFSLHFEPLSLVYGFFVGLIVPIAVLMYMAFKIGRLNIVKAIREIEDNGEENKHRNFIMTLVLFLLSVLVSIWAIYSLNAILTYGAIITSALIFPFFFADNLRRIVGNFFSFSVIVFAFSSNLIPFISEQSNKSLWLLGLRSFSILLAALFLLSYNFEIFDKFLGIFSLKKYRAAVKLAVAETAHHKRRTGLTIAMYSIVIFVISLMTVIPYSETLQINSAKSTIFGGYDTVGIPIIGKLNVSPSQLSNLDYITYYATMSMVSAKYMSNGKVSPDYQMVILNKRLVDGLDLQVNSAVNGIKDLKSLYDYLDSHPGSVAVFGVNGVKIGQKILISNEGSSNFNFSQSSQSQNVTSTATALKNPKEFTVVGILQSNNNYNAIPAGFYTTMRSASAFENLSPTEFLLTKLAGTTEEAQYENFQKLTAFLKTRFIFALFSKQTVEIFTNILNGFVNIVNVFLYFGLSVGIIGLAILIVKSLHERKKTVGILKALGFSKNLIFTSFFLEINFVVILGILIGFITGVVTSYLIYATLNLGTIYIPLWQFAILGIVFYLISILTTFIPTRNATRIPPVEALRYRE